MAITVVRRATGGGYMLRVTRLTDDAPQYGTLASIERGDTGQ
jgi:hypothetical protein